MMKQNALWPALAALGLAALPTHAQAQGLEYFNTSIAAPFTAALNSFGPDSLVDIQATDAGDGQTYAAGQFGFDGSEFQVLNLTEPDNSFAGHYNITPELYFDNLLLTENFSNGTTQTLPLFDIGDPTMTPTNTSDPFDIGPDGMTPLTGDLQTNPVTLAGGPTLTSAVLTGDFSDAGPTVDPNSPPPVQVQIAVVPEPGTDALLLIGLLPVAALALRARRSVRRS